MTKLLACGDLQLGAGVDRFGPERLDDQAKVWSQIVDLALEHNVDALLLGGDMWERRRPSPAELLAFQQPLEMLRDEAILVVACAGNHDTENLDRPIALDLFADLLHVSREPSRDIYLNGPPGVTVCTLPWVPLGRLVAEADGGDRDDLLQVAAEHLLTIARGLRAQAQRPAVLLLHWSLSGASLPSGLPIEHAREVILDTAEFEAMGWNAVVAAHVHRPQLLGSEDSPGPILYVGSPLPHDFGEADTDHGCWLIDFDHVSTSAEPAGYKFLPIESRPFITLDYNGEELTDWHYVGQEGEPNFEGGWHNAGRLDEAIVRLRYAAIEEQSKRIDKRALRQSLLDAGAWRVYIQEEILREARARVSGLDESVAEEDAFGLWLDANEVPEEQRASLHARHEGYAAEVQL